MQDLKISIVTSEELFAERGIKYISCFLHRLFIYTSGAFCFCKVIGSDCTSTFRFVIFGVHTYMIFSLNFYKMYKILIHFKEYV